MIRCWEVEPTNIRVLQYFNSWEFAHEKIIAAQGCVVQGLALQHGHRAQKINGAGECSTRISNQHRKATLVARPVYNDAKISFNLMIGTDNQIEIAQEVANVQQEVKNEAINNI
jgi:hypothetical protein